ncbi:SymE family type I addiction module toxin [Pseudenterobacter timonensis]|uniref:SymE family type I addiction module toxin n=1 Tax=Pseudenterobacter timonensis TaxID=1755099 RepID=A0ABV4A3M8_9ENTR
MTAYYSRHSSLHLKGNWLKESGFETGEQLYQAKKVVKGIKDGMFSVLNGG